ncbi:hypothetical protein PNP59_14400 [Halobacterium salinarum]|uniref:hypothetical protein n=1 Tax=Halobacterium salinarum TaxID=2242 RepID=UPI002555853A|nr:hypothetical protein [Halobacterium salinarum]MDL0130933.1 hypothetical protein [Halobacterium salinarum]MDL0132094.1 hypothetical protein [Halobacterium salinarum]
MTERTMRSVSQRNPADPQHAVGMVFRRGPTIVADGGERGAGATQRPDGGEASDDDERDEDRRTADGQRMKDVDQTPPDEDASANRVWERGGEPPASDDQTNEGEGDETVDDE